MDDYAEQGFVAERGHDRYWADDSESRAREEDRRACVQRADEVFQSNGTTEHDFYGHFELIASGGQWFVRPEGGVTRDYDFSIDYNRLTVILKGDIIMQQGVVDQPWGEIDDLNKRYNCLAGTIRLMVHMNSNMLTQSAELASAGNQEQ
jgi:hypothetical protein